ncbi:MAG: hypothetical protein ACNA8L_03095 [Luteolibacter sp.]
MKPKWTFPGSLLCAVMCFTMAANMVAEPGRWVGQWMTAQEAIVDGESSDETAVESATREIAPSPGIAASLGMYLVDGQGLLSPGSAAARMEFLQHHAEDSKIPLYVHVLGEGASASAHSRLDPVFGDENAALVVYFLGEPQRAGFYLSPPLLGVVSEAEQRRSLQSSIMQAAGKAEPEEQLEAFLVQMSIRLYWMERMMDEGVSDTGGILEIEQKPAVVKPNRWPEFALPADALPWIAAGGGMMIFLPIAWWVVRARARYRFPEFEVERRLGGRHAAGVGGVISYLSTNVPPAAQREQTPDDLPRM